MVTKAVEYIDYLFGGPPQRDILFEDEQCIVYDEEVNRQAPVHFVVVPRKTVPRVCATTADDEKLLGHMLIVAKNMVLQMGLNKSGYHLMVDESYQKKTLVGIHVFGRALHHMLWPVGPGCRL